MHQIQFLGLRPRPRWGSLRRSPRSLTGFRGPTFKGKEEGEEREEKRKGEMEGGKENGMDRIPQILSWPASTHKSANSDDGNVFVT